MNKYLLQGDRSQNFKVWNFLETKSINLVKLMSGFQIPKLIYSNDIENLVLILKKAFTAIQAFISVEM